MNRRVKKKDHENLSASNLRHVISLLQPTSTDQKPITKKEACAILNITYNTTRLNTIIQEFLEREEYVEKRKAQNRGKAPSQNEIKEAVSDYLQGDNISNIAKYLYRSPNFVKNILERVGVPQRPPSAEDRKSPAFLPENCVAEEFAEKEIVWSACYHAPAVVIKKEDKPIYQEKYSSDCYQIYIFEKASDDEGYLAAAGVGGFYANSLAYDLGKLSHLKDLGIDLGKQVYERVN